MIKFLAIIKKITLVLPAILAVINTLLKQLTEFDEKKVK